MENNANRPVSVQISGVKKMYKLGQIGGGTLSADLQSWWARIRGKEDPNSKIGTDQRLIGKTFMALNGIDLTVYQGEALGIIGTNGAAGGGHRLPRRNDRPGKCVLKRCDFGHDQSRD